MEQRETTGIGWFVAGLGLGALLGVLFAPKPGREIREGLISSARDSKDFVTSRSKQARDQINSAVDRGRDQVNQYTERGKEVAEKGRERWGDFVDRVSGGAGNSGHGDEPDASRGGDTETHY